MSLFSNLFDEVTSLLQIYLHPYYMNFDLKNQPFGLTFFIFVTFSKNLTFCD